MLGPIARSLLRLTVPGGSLLLGLWLLVEHWAEPALLQELARVWPHAMFAGALLLAWWFRQLRLLVVLLAVALTERATVYLSLVELDSPSRFFDQLLAFALGVNLIWIGFVRRRGRLAWRNAGAVVALMIQALLFTLLLSPASSAARAAVTAVAARLPIELGWLAGALLVTVLAFNVWSSLRGGGAAERGLLWALVAVALALAGEPASAARTLYFAGAGLLLVLAILEASYQMAYADELTGLPSRRALNEELDALGEEYAIAVVDVDHFKQVNDRYGHAVGDQVLAAVAAQVRRVGGGGRGFRYGGEEFAILFPGRSAVDVLPDLDELRRDIAATPFTLRHPKRPRKKPKRPRIRSGRGSLRVTVSIGVAQRTARRVAPTEVLKAADQALYRAKRGGRDQVSR